MFENCLALEREYADLGIISDDEGRSYYVGDNVQLAIGQGLLSATPMQLATGYATIANGGLVLQPTILKAIWNPGVPDGEPGYVDLTQGTLHTDASAPTRLERFIGDDSLRWVVRSRPTGCQAVFTSA